MARPTAITTRRRNMIDFHTHILPDVDDGSQSIRESVSLLREEGRMGIQAVVMTPHFYAHQQSPAAFLKEREWAWKKLAPYLWKELPDVFLGAEVQYFEGICHVEDMHRLRIETTPYLLVEMPFSRWTDRMIEDVLELQQREDIQVVLAHIERYMAYQPARVWKLLRERGILMQANVAFFENWKTRGRAMTMLKNGEIQLLGSDCHNMKGRRPNWDLLPEDAWHLASHSEAYLAFHPGQARKLPVMTR